MSKVLMEEVPLSVDYTKINDFVYLAGKARYFGHLLVDVIRGLVVEEKRVYSIDEIINRLTAIEPTIELNAREEEYLRTLADQELRTLYRRNEKPLEPDLVYVEGEGYYTSSNTKLRSIVSSLTEEEKETLKDLLNNPNSSIPIFGTSITKHRR